MTFHFSPEDDEAITERFAAFYENQKGTACTPELLGKACGEIEAWFNKIPVPVQWHRGGEPYSSYDDMVADIGKGVFKVRDYVGDGYHSPLWGDWYNKMRAVHDYFGHYAGNNAFGILGELGAYGIHVGMFSPEVCPLIFNEIVLRNASIVNHHFETNKVEDKFVPFTA